MNHPHSNRPHEAVMSPNPIETTRIKPTTAPTCHETKATRVHPVVGPAAILAACGWFLFRRLQSLQRFLRACGLAATTLAGRTRNKLAGQVGFHRQEGTPADAAARSVATCGWGAGRVAPQPQGQTQQIRELGQLGQPQKWLKRYKTGMFANLAMLANVFSPNRPATGQHPRHVRPFPPQAHPAWGPGARRSEDLCRGILNEAPRQSVSFARTSGFLRRPRPFESLRPVLRSSG